MMQITEALAQIQNAVYGREVRQAIHDGIKRAYDDASEKHDNANMEVKLARGNFDNLGRRLEGIEKKINSGLTGSPKTVVQQKTDLSSVDPDTDLVLVIEDGHLYYRDQKEWVDVGAYQAEKHGVTLKNKLKNNSFSEKSTLNNPLYWGTVGAEISENDEITTVKASVVAGNFFQSNISDVDSGDKIYVGAIISTDSNKVSIRVRDDGTLENLTVLEAEGNEKWESFSNIFEAKSSSNLRIQFVDMRDSNWTNFQVTKPIIINLTKAFGKGNEPGLEEFKKILNRKVESGYFETDLFIELIPANIIFPAVIDDQHKLNIMINNGIVEVMSDYDNDVIFYRLGRRGPNNIFDFNSILLPDKQHVVSSDFFGPYIVKAVNNVDGDLPSDPIFTGGNHNYNSRGTLDASPTGRTVSLNFYVDDQKVSSFNGNADKLRIEWVNRIQAYNTRKYNGNGREVLEERYTLMFDGDKWSVTNEIELLEDVIIERYYGLQAQVGVWNDKYLFVGSENRKYINVGTAANSINNETNIIRLKNKDNDILDLDIDNKFDLGKSNLNTDEHNALASQTKVYFNLISNSNKLLTKGDIYHWRGSYQFYKK